MMAVHVASEIALRMIKDGGNNKEVTAAITKACEAFNCKPIEGVNDADYPSPLTKIKMGTLVNGLIQKANAAGVAAIAPPAPNPIAYSPDQVNDTNPLTQAVFVPEEEKDPMHNDAIFVAVDEEGDGPNWKIIVPVAGGILSLAGLGWLLLRKKVK